MNVRIWDVFVIQIQQLFFVALKFNDAIQCIESGLSEQGINSYLVFQSELDVNEWLYNYFLQPELVRIQEGARFWSTWVENNFAAATQKKLLFLYHGNQCILIKLPQQHVSSLVIISSATTDLKHFFISAWRNPKHEDIGILNSWK